MTPPTSKFCNQDSAVILIRPDQNLGGIQIHGKTVDKLSAYMILPNSGHTLACPLNYVQTDAFWSNNWIKDDLGRQQRFAFRGISRIAVVLQQDGQEARCSLPGNYEQRLQSFFRMDIPHHAKKYQGWDCLRFVSHLASVKFSSSRPRFQYVEEDPESGDIVALSTGGKLPNSIKHWALAVGSDAYLSKFGMTGFNTQSLVEVTNLENMVAVYNCSDVYIATPQGK